MNSFFLHFENLFACPVSTWECTFFQWWDKRHGSECPRLAFICCLCLPSSILKSPLEIHEFSMPWSLNCCVRETLIRHYRFLYFIHALINHTEDCTNISYEIYYSSYYILHAKFELQIKYTYYSINRPCIAYGLLLRSSQAGRARFRKQFTYT